MNNAKWFLERHKELWRKVKELIVADYKCMGIITTHLDEYKIFALEELGYDPYEVECKCFACEYAKQKMIDEGELDYSDYETTDVNCDKCLLNWKTRYGGCCEMNSAYWNLSKLLQKNITDDDKFKLAMKLCDEIIGLKLREEE